MDSQPNSPRASGAPGTRPATALDPQPGAVIGGRYTIVRLLARGGVGLVYLARQAVTNEPVVVKVLAANLIGDAETRARFDREAQRLRSVTHPNIVSMISYGVDHGQAHGSAFLVMEYLEGELLSAYAARKGPLSLADFTPIAAQILKAVGYAHGMGLMHRDLKPSNIMLCTRKGRANFVKVLDFGMAKLVEGERDITSEQIVGTANYLSPEQIKGEDIDARVDVYALGVMFYNLLAGHLPFKADNNAALLYKHVHEPPPPLAQALAPGHDIPPKLIALVHRCLAKDRSERFADATAVVEALVACAPAKLFHLPVASGGTASASSSYAVLPTELADLSGRLTRPVQALRNPAGASPEVEPQRTQVIDAVEFIDDPHPPPARPPMAPQGGRGRRAPRIAVASAPTPSVPVAKAPTGLAPLAHLGVPEEPQGARVWLFLAAAVLLGLVGVGGYLLTWDESNTPADASTQKTEAEEQRLIAQLDQVEADLLEGYFDRARTNLDEIEPKFARWPAHKSRADGLRRRLLITVALDNAEYIEKEGDVAAAVSAYRDVLALDSANSEARAAIARLEAGPDQNTEVADAGRPSQPERTSSAGAATRPRESSPNQPGPPAQPAQPVEPVKAADREVQGDFEIEAPKPSGEELLDPTPTKDGPVFLPTER